MAVLTQYIHYLTPETFHLYCCFLGKGQAEILLIVTLYTDKNLFTQQLCILFVWSDVKVSFGSANQTLTHAKIRKAGVFHSFKENSFPETSLLVAVLPLHCHLYLHLLKSLKEKISQLVH